MQTLCRALVNFYSLQASMYLALRVCKMQTLCRALVNFCSLQASMYLALRVCIMQALCQGRQLSIPYKHLCISRHENCRRAILCVLVNRDCSLQTLFYFAKIGRTLITCSIPASSLNVFSGTAPSTSMIL